MKAGKYSIRELFVNTNVDQIIIPEIQRDYVWGPEQITGLLKLISDDFRKFTESKIQVETNDEEIKSLFSEFYKKQKFSSNIGFIYAYNDPEYIGKYFLIDGQQRITTIYLLLLALSVKLDKKTFEKYYFNQSKLKVDYRVRESAHLFLDRFVNYVLAGGDTSFEVVKNQHWYFSSNDHDPTIQSIITNYNSISIFLKEKNLFDRSFLNYTEHYIDFWYFDTNLSDQGEELYIYMNARGEQIQQNENLKAELLGNLTTKDLESLVSLTDYNESHDLPGLKNYWGRKWECWQDFFWHHRGKNDNADVGFNEFIACISGLEVYIKRDQECNHSTVLTLPGIERAMQCLQFLEECKTIFPWVNNYYNLIWSYLNKTIKRSANWFADYKDRNKNDDRNNMVIMWSLFLLYRSSTLDEEGFFRVIRLFYVRYHNYNRSVSTLENTIEIILNQGLIEPQNLQLIDADINPEEETDSKFKTSEEIAKYNFLSQFTDRAEVLQQFEKAIWEIEDHKFNLDGSYLKNINITHLVDFSLNPSLEHLQKVKDRFYLLMSFTNGFTEEKLVSLLLHYGNYAFRETPMYYYNYEFDNWKRIIRNTDGDKNAFRIFFNEFLATDVPMDLNYFLNKKNLEFLNDKIDSIFDITDFKEQLIVYYILLGDAMWSEGFHMCYEGLPQQRLFTNEYEIFNTQRYKGSHKYLWDILVNKYGSDRSAIENILETKQQKLEIAVYER